MKTTAIALAVVLAAGTATIAAYAQPAPGQGPQQQQRWQPSQADRAAFLDARIAALKAGLKLTAEQEKLWGPLEATLRDTATKRQARMAELWKERAAQTTPPDFLDRMKRRADFMSDTGADMRRVVDAAGPLYKTLDDGQKNRLNALMRFGHRGFMGGQFGPRHFGQGYGRGYGMDGYGPRGFGPNRFGSAEDGASGYGPGRGRGPMGQGMGPGMGQGWGMGPGSRF